MDILTVVDRCVFSGRGEQTALNVTTIGTVTKNLDRSIDWCINGVLQAWLQNVQVSWRNRMAHSRKAH